MKAQLGLSSGSIILGLFQRCLLTSYQINLVALQNELPEVDKGREGPEEVVLQVGERQQRVLLDNLKLEACFEPTELKKPVAYSLNKKVVAFQWQFKKAMLLERI